MGCSGTGSSQTFRVRQSVWSDGSTSPIFIPFTDALPTMNIAECRMHYEHRGRSGTLSITRACRFSNDGVTWDSAQTVGSSDTTLGYFYGSYAAIPPSPKKFIQFGLSVANNSAGNSEKGQIDLTIDVRS